MNYPPTLRSVRAKLTRPGALFASDEVRVLEREISRLENQIAALRSHQRELVEKFVGSGSA